MDATILYLASTTDPFVLGIVTALLGGGAISAFAQFKRTKPQGQLDIANAAKVLYDHLEDANDRLREENVRVTHEAERVRSVLEDQHEINQRMLEQLEHCNGEIKVLRADRDRLLDERQ